jgi:hypothetical protein
LWPKEHQGWKVANARQPILAMGFECNLPPFIMQTIFTPRNATNI